MTKVTDTKGFILFPAAKAHQCDQLNALFLVRPPGFLGPLCFNALAYLVAAGEVG